MANTSSAQKATRVIARRTEVNKARRTRMRTMVVKVEEAITSGDRNKAMEAMKRAARDSGIELRQSRLAVLGATGNIGATLALMMAPQVESTLLIVRDAQSPRDDLIRVWHAC